MANATIHSDVIADHIVDALQAQMGVGGDLEALGLTDVYKARVDDWEAMNVDRVADFFTNHLPGIWLFVDEDMVEADAIIGDHQLCTHTCRIVYAVDQQGDTTPMASMIADMDKIEGVIYDNRGIQAALTAASRTGATEFTQIESTGRDLAPPVQAELRDVTRRAAAATLGLMAVTTTAQ